MSWGMKRIPGAGNGNPMSGSVGGGDYWQRRANQAARSHRMTRPSRRTVKRGKPNDSKGPGR